MSSGTNRERLTQNNAKIEELIELVKTKASGEGSEQLTNFGEYELPEMFATSSNQIHIMSNGDILFSCAVANSGIWVYDNESKTVSQKYSLGASWKSFYDIEGMGCLIGSGVNATSASSGILFYDSITKTVTQIYSAGYSWGDFIRVGDVCLISSQYSGASGTVLFNLTTRQTTLISNSRWSFPHIIGDDCLLGTASSGVLLYKSSTRTITSLYSSGRYWNFFQDVKDGCLISCYYEGVLLYDSNTNTISQIFDGGNYLKFYQPVDGGCLITSTSSGSAGTGVFLYDDTLRTVSRIYTRGSGWKYFHKVYGGYLISAEIDEYAASGSDGILFYDEQNKSVTSLTTRGRGYDIAYSVNNDCLLCSSQPSASTTTMFFDGEAKTISSLSIDGFGSTPLMSYIGNINDTVYIAGEGVAVYDESTKSAAMIYNDGLDLYKHIKIDNKDYIAGSNILYDVAENKMYPTLFFKNVFNNFTYNNSYIYDVVTKKHGQLTNYYNNFIEKDNFLIMHGSTLGPGYFFYSNKFAIVDCSRN